MVVLAYFKVEFTFELEEDHEEQLETQMWFAVFALKYVTCVVVFRQFIWYAYTDFNVTLEDYYLKNEREWKDICHFPFEVCDGPSRLYL